jgi:hypothetical protein
MTLDRRRRVGRPVIALVISLGFALAACSSAATSSPTLPSASSAGVAASSAATAATTAATASQAAVKASSTTSQTDTDWGRIWDSLPKDFPAIAGATPDDAAAGPASAVLVVPGDVAKTVATSLQTTLGAMGYTATGLGGPLEDGTYTLDMTGATTDCMLQVTATPTGGVTTVTILYGAACPHD